MFSFIDRLLLLLLLLHPLRLLVVVLQQHNLLNQMSPTTTTTTTIIIIIILQISILRVMEKSISMFEVSSYVMLSEVGGCDINYCV